MHEIAATVDRSLCVGSGPCFVLAPRAFELDHDMKAVVLNAGGRKRGKSHSPRRRSAPLRQSISGATEKAYTLETSVCGGELSVQHRRIIKRGPVVVATNEDGSMDPASSASQGLFLADTRYLSTFQALHRRTNPGPHGFQ